MDPREVRDRVSNDRVSMAERRRAAPVAGGRERAPAPGAQAI
jgi:hypothetical protein